MVPRGCPQKPRAIAPPRAYSVPRSSSASARRSATIPGSSGASLSLVIGSTLAQEFPRRCGPGCRSGRRQPRSDSPSLNHRGGTTDREDFFAALTVRKSAQAFNLPRLRLALAAGYVEKGSFRGLPFSLSAIHLCLIRGYSLILPPFTAPRGGRGAFAPCRSRRPWGAACRG